MFGTAFAKKKVYGALARLDLARADDVAELFTGIYRDRRLPERGAKRCPKRGEDSVEEREKSWKFLCCATGDGRGGAGTDGENSCPK